MTSPVWVVEDDGLIRMDLADTLADAGFAVLEAASADEAMSVLQKAEVGALLTDIDMAGSMNGIDLANRVAKQWPACRIIVISGRYSPSQDSLPSGARFLSKPISEKALSHTMTEMDLVP